MKNQNPLQCFQEDLKALNKTWDITKKDAVNRKQRKLLSAQCTNMRLKDLVLNLSALTKISNTLS